jgi:hypothetical protein
MLDNYLIVLFLMLRSWGYWAGLILSTVVTIIFNWPALPSVLFIAFFSWFCFLVTNRG